MTLLLMELKYSSNTTVGGHSTVIARSVATLPSKYGPLVGKAALEEDKIKYIANIHKQKLEMSCCTGMVIAHSYMMPTNLKT